MSYSELLLWEESFSSAVDTVNIFWALSIGQFFRCWLGRMKYVCMRAGKVWILLSCSVVINVIRGSQWTKTPLRSLLKLISASMPFYERRGWDFCVLFLYRSLAMPISPQYKIKMVIPQVDIKPLLGDRRFDILYVIRVFGQKDVVAKLLMLVFIVSCSQISVKCDERGRLESIINICFITIV